VGIRKLLGLLHLSSRAKDGDNEAFGGFLGFMVGIISYIQNNTVVAIAITVILLFLIYRKPKLFLGILFLGIFLAVVFYLITGMAGSGSKQKKRLLLEEERQFDTNR